MSDPTTLQGIMDYLRASEMRKRESDAYRDTKLEALTQQIAKVERVADAHGQMLQSILVEAKTTNGRITLLEGAEIKDRIHKAQEQGKSEAQAEMAIKMEQARLAHTKSWRWYFGAMVAAMGAFASAIATAILLYEQLVR